MGHIILAIRGYLYAMEENCFRSLRIQTMLQNAANDHNNRNQSAFIARLVN